MSVELIIRCDDCGGVLMEMNAMTLTSAAALAERLRRVRHHCDSDTARSKMVDGRKHPRPRQSNTKTVGAPAELYAAERAKRA